MKNKNPKSAIITGASSGIGADCAVALAKEGFDLCITARRENLLEEIRCEASQYSKVLAIPGDITDHAHRIKLIGNVMEEFGRIDVLVNNAGFAIGGVVEDIDLEQMGKQLEVNTLAPLAMMQLVGPIMRAKNSGRIINISSISGIMAVPGLGGYAASKFAIEAISDAARREYHPWGIKVILVEPGGIATDIWKSSSLQINKMRENTKSGAFKKFYEKQQENFLDDLVNGNAPGVEIVTKAVIHAATSKRPKPRYTMPRQSVARKIVSHLPTNLEDAIVRKYVKVEK